MADIETLGIVDEIQALVSDKLQVVSYKWLSRNFLVSSDSAKRLLQEFVEKHGDGLEVVYSLSGWLKNSPSTYHIRLVSTPNLAEAKKEFSDDCSVQVYSVQTCIPKDPVALWNAEFVQAEELFRQPLSDDNCLLDNRFCGVSNPFVKRNGGGTISSTTTVPQVKSEASGLSKSNSTAQVKPEQKKVQLPSPSASESHGTSGPGEDSKIVADKHKISQLPAAKKAVQSDKSSKNGGALANMWGRVPTKPKVDNVLAVTGDAAPNPVGNNAAQVCALERVEDRISDDEDQQVSMRRSSNGEGNRKRRVIFDYSDEEDDFKDAVNLASPDPPKQKSILGSKQTPSIPELEKQEVKKAKEAESKSHEQERKPSPTSEPKKSKVCSSEIISEHVSHKKATVKDEGADAAPISPKRRKVMKTRIDERGREDHLWLRSLPRWLVLHLQIKPVKHKTRKQELRILSKGISCHFLRRRLRYMIFKSYHFRLANSSNFRLIRVCMVLFGYSLDWFLVSVVCFCMICDSLTLFVKLQIFLNVIRIDNSRLSSCHYILCPQTQPFLCKLRGDVLSYC